MQVVIFNAINGDNAREPSVPVNDRAFNYGDGCFTTMYALGHCIFLLDTHIKRLSKDAQRLGITFSGEILKDTLLKTWNSLSLSSHEAYVVKILLSRGCGGRGYNIPEVQHPSAYISFHNSVTYHPSIATDTATTNAHSFVLSLADIKLACQPMLAGIKHLNRLEQILAKNELVSLSGVDDLILCDTSGFLIEATAANVFILIDDVWCCPQHDQAGVEGLMRNTLIEYFIKANIAYRIGHFTVDDCKQAKAMLLTNALKFIIPVSEARLDKTNSQSILFNMDIFAALIPDFYEFTCKLTGFTK